MTKSKTDAKNIKKKIRKNIVVGVAHIQATFNNTIVTIADLRGNTISWSSAGMHGFTGAKKATPHAAQLIVDHAAGIAKEHGLKTISVKVTGPGNGREAALKALGMHFSVASIKDITPVAHNGCRPPKRRRV
jgi:small subunit ribosomal protein S11